MARLASACRHGLWCRAWCRCFAWCCLLGVVLLGVVLLGVVLLGVVLFAWCFAWCRLVVVPGVVAAYGGEHDRHPDHPAGVQGAVAPQVVDPAQLPGPGVEPDGDPGRGVAALDPVADQRPARVARPAVPLGGDQPDGRVGRVDPGRGGGRGAAGEHGRAEQHDAAGGRRGHRRGEPAGRTPGRAGTGRGGGCGWGKSPAGSLRRSAADCDGCDACGQGVPDGRPWQSGRVEETRAPETPLDRPSDDDRQELAGLVGDWLDWSQAGDLLQRQREQGPPADPRAPARGRRARRPARARRCPPALIQDGLVVKGVPGVLTVLHDGGYDDARGAHLAVHARRDAPRPADRRAAREPRRGGQAARPGDGVLSPAVSRPAGPAPCWLGRHARV